MSDPSNETAPWAPGASDSAHDQTAPLGPRPPPVDHAAGQMVAGRYLVIDPLGSGGMGTVVRAYDPKLRRELAIKQLRSRVFDAALEARLVREARSLAQLSHPNVVAIYDVHDGTGEVVIAMELVRGQTLRGWLKKPRGWREVVSVLLQAGRGLAAAHGAHLVHRDFKPANVMLTDDGLVKVMDFGLAKSLGPDASAESEQSHSSFTMLGSSTLDEPLTEANIVMGTPPFMAPEQHTGKATEPSVDQYAFCVSAWLALTGRRPFPGSGKSLLRAKHDGPPRWPGRPAVPRRLVDAIRRGMNVDADARWPSMDALLEQFERTLRPSGRGRLLVGSAVLGGGITTAILVPAQGPAPCTDAQQHLAGIWDEPARERVQQSIEAAGAELAEPIWAQTSAHLDTYAQAWTDGHLRACEASARGEQSDAILDRRMACLQRARSSFRASTRQLAALDERSVVRAIELAVSLPPLTHCADVEGLLAAVPPPEDPQVRAAVESIHDRLADAQTEHRLGRYDSAMAIVRALWSQAEGLGHPPLEAELLTIEGRIQEALGTFEASEHTLRQASWMSIEHGPSELAIGALMTWAFVLSDRLERRDEGQLAAELGLRLARRKDGGSVILEAMATGRLASVLGDRGDHDRAEALYREALALLGTDESADELDQALLLNDLGTLLIERGRFEEALALHQQAIEIRRRRFGPSHPYVGSSLTNIGNTVYQLGRMDEAQRAYEDTLAIYERAYGVLHPLTTMTRGNLGAMMIAAERYDEAERILLQVAEEHEQVYGPDHTEVAAVYNNLGALAQQRDALPEAMKYLERAHDIWRNSLGPDHPQLRTSHHNLGLAAIDLGHRDEAIEHLEDALAASPDARPDLLADTKVELGKLLGEDPAQLPRARQLVQDAAELYRTNESSPEIMRERLAEAEQWLSAHEG